MKSRYVSLNPRYKVKIEIPNTKKGKIGIIIFTSFLYNKNPQAIPPRKGPTKAPITKYSKPVLENANKKIITNINPETIERELKITLEDTILFTLFNARVN